MQQRDSREDCNRLQNQQGRSFYDVEFPAGTLTSLGFDSRPGNENQSKRLPFPSGVQSPVALGSRLFDQIVLEVADSSLDLSRSEVTTDHERPSIGGRQTIRGAEFPLCENLRVTRGRIAPLKEHSAVVCEGARKQRSASTQACAGIHFARSFPRMRIEHVQRPGS